MTLPSLLCLGVATFTSQGKPAPAPPEAPVAKYIVLATADPAVAKRARTGDWNVSTAKFAAQFPPQRFEVLPWDTEKRIVVDRTTGILGRVADRMTIERGLIAKIDKTGLVDMADLSPEEYEAVKTLFGTWPTDPDTHRSVEPDSLGLTTMYAVVLRSGGTTRRFTKPVMNPRESAVEKALTQRALGRQAGAAGALPVKSGEAEPVLRDSIGLVYLLPSRDWLDATGYASDAIREISERMRHESEKLGTELMSKLGYSGDPSLGDLKDVHQMSSGMRRDIQDELARNWKGFGFGSKDEAMAFLNGADSFSVQTSLMLRETVRPQDPQTGRPGYDIGYEFQLLPGLYRP